jgi:hypothetical protein
MEIIRKHKIRIAVVLFLFIAFLGRYETKMPKRNFADFYVNYYTAQKLVKGENIYDDQAYRKDKVANFKYPPIVALVFYPLGFLAKNAAAVSWFTINYILIILFFYWSSRLIFDLGLKNRSRNWIYFISSLFTLRFFAHNFDEGQVNFLMMATLTLSLFLLRRRKIFRSGLALGFSSLVKYMPAIFLPYFLFKRRIKVILCFFAAIAAFFILPALILGFEYNAFLQKSFLPFLCKTSLDFNSMSTHENQSLIAMFMRYFSTLSEYKVNILSLSQLHLGFLIGAAFTFLYMVALFPSAKFKKGSQFLETIDYGMLFICVALFNPNAWIHAFIFLAFPFMVCLYYLFKIRHKDVTVWILVSLASILASWPESLFLPSLKDSVDIYSLLTLGSLILFLALAKIKFSPHESLHDSRA